MDKKVSIKSIDKVLKYYRFENKSFAFKCGDENIEITVNPAVNYEQWYIAIEEAVQGVLFDREGNYRPALTSLAYDYAITTCFTNIKSDNHTKFIDLIMNTDLTEKIKSCLPTKVLTSFEGDFNRVVNSKENEYCSRSKIMNIIEKFSSLFEGIDFSDEDGWNGLLNSSNENSEVASE